MTEDLVTAIAHALLDAQPPKIEGGSPRRRQWLADVIAVQIACMEAGYADPFMEALNDVTVGQPPREPDGRDL